MELFLINFSGAENKKENNKLQKKYSSFFVDYILENFYNCKDTLKKEESGKPYLVNSSFEISISHSENLIAILFDKQNVGVDVEFIKKRDYKKILKYYGVENNLSQIEFYQWWTVFEAEYKSKTKDNIFSFKYKDFICSISSKSSKIDNIFEINYFDNNKINIQKLEIKEFYLPLNIKNTAKTIKINPTK